MGKYPQPQSSLADQKRSLRKSTIYKMTFSYPSAESLLRQSNFVQQRFATMRADEQKFN